MPIETLGLTVVVALVTSGVTAGIAWGLLSGRVSATDRRVDDEVKAREALAEKCSVEASHLSEARGDVAVLKVRTISLESQHGTLREDIRAMESRVLSGVREAITSSIEGLRRELEASGTLRRM